MNDPNSQLIIKLNSLMQEFQKDSLLSKLPSGSWQANAILNDDTLKVGILRNDNLLMENHWYPLTDPTQWLFRFVPVISKFLAVNKSILPKNLKVLVSAKSETEEYLASCSSKELIELALSGEINEFGSMMASLELDVIKKE